MFVSTNRTLLFCFENISVEIYREVQKYACSLLIEIRRMYSEKFFLVFFNVVHVYSLFPFFVFIQSEINMGKVHSFWSWNRQCEQQNRESPMCNQKSSIASLRCLLLIKINSKDISFNYRSICSAKYLVI
jgi:hypothetical protein